MRKEYGKALRETFTQKMRTRLPQFEPYETTSDYVFLGERVFRWAPEDAPCCFVVLVPSRKNMDEFTLEVGWSTLGRFPEVSMRPAGFASKERSEFGEDEFTCRMSDLWSREDVWWQLTDFDIMNPDHQWKFIVEGHKPITAEEARAAVEPRVEEAMEKLIAYGVPYLEEYVRSRTKGP